MNKIFHVGVVMLIAVLILATSASAQVPVNGQALKFNGQDNFVRVFSNPVPTNGNFTVECWVNAAVEHNFGFRTILSQAVGSSHPYPRFYLGLDPGGQIRVGDAWPFTTVTLPLNSWHHLAVVRSSTNTLLYLDGVLRTSYGSALPNPTAAPWMDIGQQFDNLLEFWSGSIDEVRIWKTARSAAQITANASKKLTGTESGLVAYYRFDSTSGSVAANSASSGAVHRGFLTNNPAWVNVRVVTNNRDSGAGTLRRAISDSLSGDYIVFATNLSGSTIQLTNGEVTVGQSLNIDASLLRAGVIIDGNHTSRCFTIGGGATNVFTGLTITNGFLSFGGGGGIINFGNLTLNRCAIVGNNAQGGYPWGCGGGIYNYDNTLTLNQCTFTQNTVQDSGGGVFNYVGTVHANHCTVVNNFSGDAIFAGGGGVMNYSGGMTMSNTIVCNNTSLANDNLGGSYTGSGNLIGSDPQLSALGNRGGPTPTLVPLPGSPVIDAAVGSYFDTDQRGLRRNLDGNGDSASVSDIGAVEFQPSSTVSTVGDSSEGSLRATIASVPNGATITFDSAMSGQTIVLTGGQLLLNKSLTIDASTLPKGIILDGNSSSRIFEVVVSNTVTLTALTLINGYANAPGGAIYSEGTLTLNRCTLAGNRCYAPGNGGGAITGAGPFLTLYQCTLTDNHALPDNGSVGGGIYNFSSELTLAECTLTKNSATFGGGIFNYGPMAQRDSIVAGNSANSDSDIYSSVGISNYGVNLTGVDPLLAPLGNYGGPTPTMPPLPGSPAIDVTQGGFVTDQRGFSHSVEGDTNITSFSADTGATEFIPFTPNRGNYAGLFGESGGIRHVSSGYISAQVTGVNAYSAKIWLAGKSYSFSGKFDALGQSIKTISRSSLPTVTVKLYSLGPDQWFGNVTDGNWSSDLYADRLVFNSKTNRAPAAGKYTVRIHAGTPGTVVLETAHRSGPSLDSSVSPAGDGFGTLTISTGGGVAFAGTLADGTKVSQGTFLTSYHQWPFYLSPYSGAGSVIGWENIDINAPKSITGDVLWTKQAIASAKMYPLGFTNRCGITGSQYVAPAKGVRIINLPSGGFGVNYGGVTGFASSFLLGANNKIVNLSSNKLTLNFTLGSGLFNGTVVDPASLKTLTFRGAVSQNSRLGYGFFINTNQSGSVGFSDR